MELIRPTFEIWEQGNNLTDVWSHIARCTRVCYQSEKKDDKETEEEFVKRVILRNEPWDSNKNHLAMLEHGTIYLLFDTYRKEYLDYHGQQYEHNAYSKVNFWCSDEDPDERKYFITTNLRVLIENHWIDDLEHICLPTEHHAHRITVSFTTNIGVTREFNRHRVNSIAEESTRYCNYNKRNDGSVKFALPVWETTDDYVKHHEDSPINYYCEDIFDETASDWCDVDYYLFALKACEYAYNGLIAKGWKPQQAREVLPLATKSQLIHTAFVDDWKHFFALRADGVSGPPHPNAAFLAKPLKEEFIKRGLI